MNQFALILKELSQTDRECVLVTVIHVKGSAYLGEGTTMLIKNDGSSVGIISPGCLEEDVMLQAENVFQDKNSLTLIYNMADAEGWGIGNGCNGILYLTLEYIDEELKQRLTEILANLNDGLYTIHQKYLNGQYELEQTVFKAFKHQPEAFQEQKLLPNGSGYVFTHMIEPKTRLIIFGAGIDARPLVDMARHCDFHVILIDSRVSLCNKQNIPGADQYITAHPLEAIKKINLKRNDYIVLMTHHFLHDKNILQKLIGQSLDYIGIMGTKERSKKLLDSNIPSNVYTPVGLSIGAEGPYEIAVSILAELIHIRNEKRKTK